MKKGEAGSWPHSREFVGGSEKLVEWRVLGGGGAKLCLGCMHSGRCSFKNVQMILMMCGHSFIYLIPINIFNTLNADVKLEYLRVVLWVRLF